MLISILRQTSIGGQPARVGDVIEASDRDGRLLIAMGKAENVDQLPQETKRNRNRKPQPQGGLTNGRDSADA